MKLALLHLDGALKAQPDFLEYCQEFNANKIDLEEVSGPLRLWGKKSDLDSFQNQLKFHLNKLKKDNSPLITFMGSGDFHHVSKIIMSCLMEDKSDPITVVHFDNHPDWVHFNGGMHCGSWVNKALEIKGVEKIITIGVCSKDLNFPEFKGANLELLKTNQYCLFPYEHSPSFVFKEYGTKPGFEQIGRYIHWQNISEDKYENFIHKLISQITTKRIYITIDKDVLSYEDAITNWDQGKMPLQFLINVVRKLFSAFDILGVDVNGDYSKPNYSGPWFDILKKRAEIMIDQTAPKFSDYQISACNTKTNLELMKLFQEFV